jgi:hypothetical protein
MLIRLLDALAYARGLQSQGLRQRTVASMVLDRFGGKYGPERLFIPDDGRIEIQFSMVNAVLYFDGTEWRLDGMSAPLPANT